MNYDDFWQQPWRYYIELPIYSTASIVDRYKELISMGILSPIELALNFMSWTKHYFKIEDSYYAAVIDWFLRMSSYGVNCFIGALICVSDALWNMYSNND